jgi:hypothetical protein
MDSYKCAFPCDHAGIRSEFRRMARKFMNFSDFRTGTNPLLRLFSFACNGRAVARTTYAVQAFQGCPLGESFSMKYFSVSTVVILLLVSIAALA